MRTAFFQVAALAAALPMLAAERAFDFGDVAPGPAPPGFHSTVAGQGGPGEWKVIWDEDSRQASTSNAPAVLRQAVLAQVARDATDQHFPMLIFDGEAYRDFKFTARFKIAGGAVAQMAGLVFRFQDEKNYYVLGASSLDNRVWFFKVVNGVRGPLIGPQVPIEKGTWHSLTVECTGNHIHCLFDGKEIIPLLGDNSFSSGKIGFWTKSDSVGYFTDGKVTSQSREILARKLVSDALKEYPRLLDLKIYTLAANSRDTSVVAGKNEKDIGQAGSQTELEVIGQGTIHYEKDGSSARVTLPLCDRNGDPFAAVCVVLRATLGQTRDNAIIRARPVAQMMQARVRSLEDLLR
jgi:hypothetical protein